LNLEVRSSLGFNQRQSAAGRKRNAKNANTKNKHFLWVWLKNLSRVSDGCANIFRSLEKRLHWMRYLKHAINNSITYQSFKFNAVSKAITFSENYIFFADEQKVWI
jgi:hypothetical protein